MKLERLRTPALIVDEEAFGRNIEAMKALLEGSSLSLRPHYKSHKCAEIARMQIASGAIGITCAKLSEAEDLVDAGIEDVLIANQVVEESKISRLCQLAKDARITVCVDCAENIAALSRAAVAADATLYCLVEYDIGLQRCGVLTHSEVIDLARAVDAADGLVFDGVQAYAGQLSHEADSEKRRSETEARAKDLRALLSELEAAGLGARVLSGGSTGTSAIKAKEGLYTELQAGSYLFMDSTYAELDIPFENSLYILTTVLSVKDGLVVVDAGVKSCGVDQGMPRIYWDEAREISACEEHFQIFEPKKQYKVGDKLLLIPAHCCSTVNLYDKIYMVNKGRVVSRIAVSARGCSK